MMESFATISTLMSDERNTMISRAIRSARHHGINLKPGTSNPGLGYCAFESVVQNNNDRMCYTERFPLSINTYRQIWVTDMANRTVDSDWNIYSRQEWLMGWQRMLVPGTYEMGIYGDLMLPGIACGIRKYLLIFNTNPQSPHDPIYVVNPGQFNVQADSMIPIMLAYNQSHYESLHPEKNTDVQSSIRLVAEYLGNRYRFSKRDFPFLLGLDDKEIASSPDDLRLGKTETVSFGDSKNKANNISIDDSENKVPITKRKVETKYQKNMIYQPEDKTEAGTNDKQSANLDCADEITSSPDDLRLGKNRNSKLWRFKEKGKQHFY